MCEDEYESTRGNSNDIEGMVRKTRDCGMNVVENQRTIKFREIADYHCKMVSIAKSIGISKDKFITMMSFGTEMMWNEVENEEGIKDKI